MSKNYNDFKKDYKYTKFENKVKNLFKSEYYKENKFLFYANIFNAVFNTIFNSYYIAGALYLISVLLYFDSFRKHIPFLRNSTQRENQLTIIIISLIALVTLLTQMFLTS